MIRPVLDTPGRLVLLTTSSRVPPGLLSADAWETLRAGRVLAREGHPQIEALRAAGVDVGVVAEADVEQMVDDSLESTLVWLVSPDGDPDLTAAVADQLGRRLEAQRPVPTLDTLAGAHDPPGAHLLDLVAVMDRLRSPDGCPWDAEQTHESLTTYLLEETYEALEAIETGDDTHLREELGDLLLQVVFHARIAQEHDPRPWSIDDVAAGIVEKLVNRHPHVFAGAEAPDAEHVVNRWETIKRAEKRRSSALDGIPAALPALSLTAKMVHRAGQAGLAVPVPEVGLPDVRNAREVGDVLLAVAMAADRLGVDPERALRVAARELGERIRATETGLAPVIRFE